MSVTFFVHVHSGIDKDTVGVGDGSSNPDIYYASTANSYTVRVKFTCDVTEDTAGDRTSYKITETLSGKILHIVESTNFQDDQIDLITDLQSNVEYTLTMRRVTDTYGNESEWLTKTFNGVESAWGYPSAPTRSDVLYGGYSGIQKDDTTELTKDLVPPEISEMSPPPLSAGNPKDTIISFVLCDENPGLGPLTVVVTINGSTAFTGGAFVAPYDGPLSSVLSNPEGNGYVYSFDRTSDYDSYSTVTVGVYAEDTVGNTLDTSYTFNVEDYTNPTIDSMLPSGTGVSKASNITLSVHDTGSGVDLPTLSVSVNTGSGPVQVLSGTTFISGWDGALSSVVANGSGGYDVVVDHVGDFGSLVSMTVYASCDDSTGNTTNVSWPFSVEDYLGPLVVPVDPLNGEISVSPDSNIVIRIEDEDSSSSIISTVYVKIDLGDGSGMKTVFSPSSPRFKPGWDGPGSMFVTHPGYISIVIDPTTNLPGNSQIVVEVIASDPTGNNERI